MYSEQKIQNFVCLNPPKKKKHKNFQTKLLKITTIIISGTQRNFFSNYTNQALSKVSKSNGYVEIVHSVRCILSYMM